MKNVILIAPPAAGKGTLSEALIENFGYAHISTGDLLREKQNDGSSLGNEIKELLKNGTLVSDDIVTKLLKDKLESTSGSFILDGYPRTINQANILSDLVKSLNRTIDSVIYLDVDKETAMKRALGRITCPKCNKIYNKYNEALMPKVSGKCDDCLCTLVSRSDDNEESFIKRFDTYIKNTKPLLDYYKDLGLLTIIDKVDNHEDTFNEVKKVII